MIKPFLIATVENARILKKVLVDDGVKHRVQSGSNWSLRCFIDSDLKNYMDITHFVFDVSSFEEQGDNFIILLEELKEKHNKAVYIIYCDKLANGSTFLDALVRKGFTNVVARYSELNENENIKQMQDDLSECFSENGLTEQKYSRYLIETPEDVMIPEPIDLNLPDYSNTNLVISVFSAQNRIGTTTFCMTLCKYFSSHNRKTALLLRCKNAEEEYELMREYFLDERNKDIFTGKSFDIITDETAEDVGDYNVVIIDCGDIHTNDNLSVNCEISDLFFLCCGIGWNELNYTISAQTLLSNVKYTTVVNSNDNEFCSLYEKELSRNDNEFVAVDYRDIDGIGSLIKL